MKNFIHFSKCPVCGSSELQDVFQVADYTVSREKFMISECNQCKVRITQDAPDAASIGPYYVSEDYISHTNTSKGFVNRLYQLVRKRTLKQKRNLIEKNTGIKKGVLLDVGSGTGFFAAEMKNSGWQVTGLEPDEKARKIAASSNGIELSDLTNFYQLPAGSFDAITLWHVLEHVHELQAYILKLKELLKPAGRLFVAVPNYTSADARIYGSHWAAYDVPRHLYHFSPISIKTLVERHGMKIVKYCPMWYDSFYVSMLSSRYKNGKTNLAASFINGLRSNLSAMKNLKKCSSILYVISR